jgi:CO/xanthine dehydrogenase Mo-binding subunit
MPNTKTSAKLVYTNKTPRGALRGFGTQITIFAMESMMDMAAEELGIDPPEIRLKNATQKGDTTVHGFIINSCGLSEAIKLAAEKSGWRDKRKEKGKNYGIGLANGTHVSGNRNVMPIFEGSAAMVCINEQGKVTVICGELDLGQGSSTVFAQIAAEEVGVGIENVKVLPVDTDVSPFAKGTYGDRVTAMGGHAVKLAAQDARVKLLSRAAEILKADVKDIDLRNGKFYVRGSAKAIATLEEIARQVVLKGGGLPIIGQGNYTVPDYVVYAGEKSQYYGNYSIAYTFLTEIAEVSVDTDTGKVDVHNFWAAVDLGKAINPKMCEGQVEGGVTMGIGYALSENYYLDEGRMLNPNFTDYKVPTFLAAPRIHSFFIETVDPATPYGAKAIGEAVGNPTAPAIANAIYHAVGVRMKDLPITPEKILKALRGKRGQ